MELSILEALSLLGFGGILGAVIISFFDNAIMSKKMLFEARVKAYAGVTSGLYLNFNVRDLSTPDEFYRERERVVNALSEPLLLSSPKLNNHLNDYLRLVTLREPKPKPSKTPIVFEIAIASTADSVLRHMRKELHVGNYKYHWWNKPKSDSTE